MNVPLYQASCTVCRCEVMERNGKKYWVVTRNDYDPESVGETTACGLPVPAKDAPVGTVFESTLMIPKLRETQSPSVLESLAQIESNMLQPAHRLKLREVRIGQNESGGFECWEPDACGPGRHALFATLPTMELAKAEVRLKYSAGALRLVSSSATEAVFSLIR